MGNFIRLKEFKMKTKLISIVLLFVGLQYGVAQKTIHNYKYVIVPEKFEFQDEADQYELNSLMKFLFEKYGMKAFLSSENVPQEYVTSKCGYLIANVSKKSTFMKRKVDFELKDCSQKIVFKSSLGESRLKDYQAGYHESLRKAFESFEKLNYEYVPLEEVVLSDSGKEVYKDDKGLVLSLEKEKGYYIGKVLESTSSVHAKGDLACEIYKTSLENIFKVVWKDKDGDTMHTIGYFDTEGNLKIDIPFAEEIKVKTFKKVAQ